MSTPAEITQHHEWDGRDADDIRVGGRPALEPVVIVEHDHAWLALDHLGSTAALGLAAKPVIDVDLAVADSADEAAYVRPLEVAGFELAIREPGCHEHRILWGDEPRVNLHVFSPDCPEPVRHLMFRDWMRAHPDDAANGLL